MNHPQNHKKWAACRAKYNADLKDKHQDNKKRKAEADSADPPKNQLTGTSPQPKA